MSEVNDFEKMLVDSGFYLLKFYFSIDKDVQEKRFNEIKNSPIKRWKYTKIDKKAQRLWEEYTYYKDISLYYSIHFYLIVQPYLEL